MITYTDQYVYRFQNKGCISNNQILYQDSVSSLCNLPIIKKNFLNYSK